MKKINMLIVYSGQKKTKSMLGCAQNFQVISWLESTQEKALKGIRKVVAECVSDLEANEEKVPQAISVRNYSGKFMVRIPPEVHRQLAHLSPPNAQISLKSLIIGWA